MRLTLVAYLTTHNGFTSNELIYKHTRCHIHTCQHSIFMPHKYIHLHMHTRVSVSTQVDFLLQMPPEVSDLP